MKDKAMYSQILDLSAPWAVDAGELNTAEGRVDIHVGHGPQEFGGRVPHTAGGWLAEIMPSLWFGDILDMCQFKTFSMLGSPA